MLQELLAGAAKTMASMRYCWLVTNADGVQARPMGRLPPEAGEDALTVRFLTDDRSRKASEIRHAGTVTAIFENQADDAYVAVTGRATLQEDRSEVRRRWKRAKRRCVQMRRHMRCYERVWRKGFLPMGSAGTHSA